MNNASFSTLDLPAELIESVAALGYDAMTPIQAQSLPPILNGQDVIAQAKTGSGKTAAFALGILSRLQPKHYAVQALVLCPTRELADQVAVAIRALARTTQNIKVLTLCGGSPFRLQAASLDSGAQIVVGTPGRVADHLRKATLNLGEVQTLVLDEADRMLEMGFLDEVEAIIRHTPPQRQTLLFSATYPEQIEAIAHRVMQSPQLLQLAEAHDQSSIEQHFYRINDDAHRAEALQLLLLKHQPESALVFCATRRETQELADQLRAARFHTLALHGDLEQRDREKTLVRFANKSIAVLVATDVAARGLDIDALDAVFNYQLARDPEVHVHRVGRTGRAGQTGMAFTLYADTEAHKLELLGERLNLHIRPEPLPGTKLLAKTPRKPEMVTLHIAGGKKQKLRPGDILGALTGEGGVAGKQVGKINVFDTFAYVAVHRDCAKAALLKLSEGKLKGRSFRVRRLNG